MWHVAGELKIRRKKVVPPSRQRSAMGVVQLVEGVGWLAVGYDVLCSLCSGVILMVFHESD